MHRLPPAASGQRTAASTSTLMAEVGHGSGVPTGDDSIQRLADDRFLRGRDDR
jgi:hypothetical protein